MLDSSTEKKLNMSQIKIFSWNVNSINARIENVVRFIKEYKPDVLLLQELKGEDHKIPRNVLEHLGYNVAISGQKSYNGVAVLSRFPISEILIRDFNGNENTARYIEAVVTVNSDNVRVASVYVPNGQSVKSEHFIKKLSFLEGLREHLCSLKGREIFVIGGDFNVAQTELDLYNPEKSMNCLGFHQREKELIQQILDDGFHDTFRLLHPHKRVYSWWDYRDRYSFQSNRGWRIDYILSSDPRMIAESGIATETRTWLKPSDHAPVFCTLTLNNR